MTELFANRGDLNKTLHAAASDLGLHCLPVTCLRVSSLQQLTLLLPPSEKVYPEMQEFIPFLFF